MPLFNFKNKDQDKQAAVESPAKQPDAKPIPNESGNVYTNLFEKPLKTEKEEPTSDILKGVFTKEDKNKPGNILGPLPELQTKIIGAFDPSKRNLKLLKITFFSLIGLSFLIIGFFYAELNPSFDLLAGMRGPNAAQSLTNSQNNLIAIQTKINYQNLILLNYYLQELSYLSDTYASARKNSGDVSTLQNEILLAYENAQAKWKEPKSASNIPAETYTAELRKKFQTDIASMKKEKQTPDLTNQIYNYEQAQKLINNKQLDGLFNKNSEDLRADLGRDDSKLYDLTQNALQMLKNNFSSINEIKAARLQWAEIVNEIEKVTKGEDTLYNTGFFDELGGIQYSAYDFDGTTNKVIITGRAKRDDGTTFSLIANLIDSLEKSAMFKDVDNRSYPKSGSQEEGYTSTFRIEFSLEDTTAY